jgi:hypothetical protein
LGSRVNIFAAGVVDTGGNLPPASLTPVANNGDNTTPSYRNSPLKARHIIFHISLIGQNNEFYNFPVINMVGYPQKEKVQKFTKDVPHTLWCQLGAGGK